MNGTWVTMAADRYSYAEELRLMREFENWRSPEFIAQMCVLTVASMSAWLVMGMWPIPVWLAIHYFLVLSEKYVLHRTAENPSRRIFLTVLFINILISVLFYILAVSVWFMDGLIYQYAAMALLVGAMMHTLLIRSRVWQVVVCHMLMNAIAFVMMSVWFFTADFSGPEQFSSAVVAGCMLTYFIVLTWEATRLHKDHRITSKALERSHKMEAIGTFSGGIAHDFNNVLNVVIGNLELARDPDNPYDQKQLLDEARTAALHGAKLTEQLMSLGRSKDAVATHVDVSNVVADARALLQRVLPANIALSVEEDSFLPILFVEESTLHASILNLGLNARDAMEKGGNIVIEARLEPYQQVPRDGVIAAPSGPTSYVCVSVEDTGTGIESKNIARVTEPFFSTKGDSGGTGLGLTMVAGFVQRSGGALNIESEKGTGTKVSIFLPVARQQPAQIFSKARVGRAQPT